MVVEYIRYTIEEARAQAFLEGYARAGESLRTSPHCRGYGFSLDAPRRPTASSSESIGIRRRGT